MSNLHELYKLRNILLENNDLEELGPTTCEDAWGLALNSMIKKLKDQHLLRTGTHECK